MMFTGLVKEPGKVSRISRAGNIYKIAIEAKAISKAAKVGDSIAVNGACLTVTEKNGAVLFFDAVEETMQRTSLGSLKEGSIVNLEDSLKVGDRIGGHFVLGHVDCLGRITDIKKGDKEASIELSIPEKFAGLVVEKGSVAIDGISLTVGEVRRGSFKAFIIPHTMEVTTLKDKKAGSEVNVEFDVLGKYIVRQKELGSPGLTEEFLKEQGFI
jgi:riboflavin synthase